MRLGSLLLILASSPLLFAQETPLTVLPYTPVLETHFMDRSVDPCTDFYKYACGNWNRLNPIPPDQARWDVYSKLTNENERFLWGLLQEVSQPKSARSSNEQKTGDFFHACMDEKAVEKAGIEPLKPTLELIANLKSVNGIAGYVAGEHRSGIDRGVLFGFGSEQDYDSAGQMIAVAKAGGLGLPDRDYYTKTDAKSQEIRQKYVEHVQHMLELLGESGPDAEADAQAAIRIETALAKTSLTRVEKRDPYNLKHKLTRAYLRRMTPAFDWDTYLNTLGAPGFQTINVTEPKFYEELNEQLGGEKLPAWQAYLRWHLVNSQAPYLSSAFAEGHFDFFDKYLRGVKAMPPRWKKCTRLVDRELGDALGQVFVAKTFSPAIKREALQVTRQIEEEMGRDIKELTWMSEPTKQEALGKLHAVVNKIGYPDRWKNYSSVQIKPDDFPGNVARAAEFEERRELNKIGRPVDRTEWFMTPPTVNAYYDPQMNDINFPAGVLEPPLFDPKLDAAPNYGNTGATIGHELTHGFDDEGRQFDAQGNLRDWWTGEDAKAFEGRVACVRNQYGNYVAIDDIHINSSLTLGEDVADLGGTLLAYIAWKQATSGQQLHSVDGLTPEQRFLVVGQFEFSCS